MVKLTRLQYQRVFSEPFVDTTSLYMPIQSILPLTAAFDGCRSGKAQSPGCKSVTRVRSSKCHEVSRCQAIAVNFSLFLSPFAPETTLALQILTPLLHGKRDPILRIDFRVKVCLLDPRFTATDIRGHSTWYYLESVASAQSMVLP